MEIGPDELQHGDSSQDMRLDVKLAFNRVCGLIDSLKVDVGPEAAAYQRSRIRNDIAKVLKIEKQRMLVKKNEFHNASVLDITSATARNHHKEPIFRFPLEQIPEQSSKRNLTINNGNGSFFSNHNKKMYTSISSGFRPVECSNEETKEQPSKRNLQTNSGNMSFFNNNNNEKMYTSFAPESRPVGHSKEDPYQSVRLGPIINEEESFGVGSDSSEEQEKETSEDSAYFFVRDWSLSKKGDNLVVTGTKTDKKGEIIKRNFVSEKITIRKDDDTIKTVNEELVLQGPLIDPKNLIPAEIKNELAKSKGFPRTWRKILLQWIDVDKQKLKKPKNVQQSKGNSPIDEKSKYNENTKGQKIVQQRKGKSPIDKKSEDNGNTKGQKIVQQRKGKSPIDKKSEDNENTKGQKTVRQRKGKSPIVKKSKDDENAKTKKNKEEQKPPRKRNKKPATCPELQNVNKADFINDEGKDDRGPFSELLGDESLFFLPQSSMTPTGLLGSIKKNVIQGRYTPPTNMFDNVYGNKSDNNSSLNTSLDDLGSVAVNNYVVKRMAKVNAKKHTKVNKKTTKPIIEENEAIHEILRAAKVKTNTTPSIIKQVFHTEEPEQSSDTDSE